MILFERHSLRSQKSKKLGTKIDAKIPMSVPMPTIVDAAKMMTPKAKNSNKTSAFRVVNAAMYLAPVLFISRTLSHGK